VSAQPRFINARENSILWNRKTCTASRLEEPVRVQVTNQLNQLLADTMTLRDLYKKCHWQVAGPTFYQLHLLYDKHYGEQNDLVDLIAERIQLLGGVTLAMALMWQRRHKSSDRRVVGRKSQSNYRG